MLTLVLTRHGLTDRSEPEQYLGQRIKAHLTEGGRAAARSLGERLQGVDFDRVISSPLERAVETARLIRGGGEVDTDSRLAEIDYGDWEGSTVDLIRSRFPEERAAWEVDPAGTRIPGGESAADVAVRLTGFLAELLENGAATSSRSACVLLVAHSTVNRVLLSIALGTPLADYRRRFKQDWANLTVLRFGGTLQDGALLLLGNDVAHIRGVRGETW